jgi:hypothetical protein
MERWLEGSSIRRIGSLWLVVDGRDGCLSMYWVVGSCHARRRKKEKNKMKKSNNYPSSKAESRW